MNRAVKWTLFIIVDVITLVVLAVVGIYGFTGMRMGRTYEVQAAPVDVTMDSASIERGRHIAVTRGCTDCHAADLSGQPFFDNAAFGHLSASNLTPGENGVGDDYTDEDWVRAIRNGIRPDGTPLIFMPSHEFTHLSGVDLGDLIAYLESLPPVDTEPRETSIGPLARILYTVTDFPLLPAEMIDHDAPLPEAIEPAPTAEYGHYLAASCAGCHGANYSGGPVVGGPPDWPPAANLTPHESGLAGWTEEDFFRALREGRRPDGSEISEVMPWKAMGQMTDTELSAIWAFLQTLPATPMGVR